MITLKDLCNKTGNKFEGDENLEVVKVCGLDNFSEGGVGFITNLASVQRVADLNIGIKLDNAMVDIEKVIMVQPENLDSPFKNRIYSDDPLVTHVKIASILHQPVKSSGKTDSTAFIGENVEIGINVTIDPNVVVYDNVKIGDNTVVRAGVVIMEGTVIGENCIIYPNVVIRDNCIIGNNVVLHPNSVVGGDGHGYYQREGKNYKIPQVGRVIIEDDVEIGSLSAVDRGRLEDTVIGKGTKIDNLVQIAHNVKIGENGLISGHSGIAGSSKVGKNLIMGGFAAISDNKTVGDNCMISGGSGVAGNLKDGSVVGGMPARPFKKWQMSVAYVGNLESLYAKVKKMEQEIKKLKTEE